MKKLFTYFLLPAVIIINAGCFLHFYKATPVNSTSNIGRATTLDSLKLKEKYFILRSGSSGFAMNNMKLSADQKTIFCNLENLQAVHRLHIDTGKGENMHYKKNVSEEVLTEVHLYMPNGSLLQQGDFTVTLDSIQKIEIIEKDRGKTTGNNILSIVGITLATGLVVAVIAVALSSCPYVSTYDGKSFSLQGEAYSGAIYPQLAKDDYMPLQMQPSGNGHLQIKISNELKEKQNTDLAELLVVTHDKNTEVLSDDNGNLYGISHPETPLTATLCNHKDVMTALQRQHDDRVLYFDDTASAGAENNVIVEFNKPAAVKQATLVLSLKNSFWLDYLYGEMTKGLGTYYNTYIQQQSKKPVAELTKWIKDQQMPLEVSVKTAAGWKKISDIGILGPAINRKIAIPIDLAGVDGQYTSIKLSSGFLFWEIDYAAIDYSNDGQFSVKKMLPVSAIDETGKNVLPSLTKADEIYLEQPVAGNSAMVDYAYSAPDNAGKTNSYILHTKGFYTHTRDFHNQPDISFLQQFKKPGALPAFSLALYKKFRNETLNTYTKK